MIDDKKCHIFDCRIKCKRLWLQFLWLSIWDYMHALPGAKCVFGLSEVETTPKDNYQVSPRK